MGRRMGAHVLRRLHDAGLLGESHRPDRIGRALAQLGSPGGASRSASSTSPKQILEERFAKDGIDKNEFEERKKTLAV